MGDPAITQSDLEAVANIYDSIRLVYKQKNPHVDASLHEAFERHIKLVMTELSYLPKPSLKKSASLKLLV